MTKKFFYSILFLSCISLAAKTDKSSQTFLFTRPCHQNLGLSQTFWYGTPLDEDHPTGVRTDVYFQKSYNKDRIRHYFLLNDRTHVKFNTTDADKDALPVWFGLPTNFSGKMTLAPEQTQAGGSFDIRHKIGPLFGYDFFKDWWVQLTMGVATVKNKLNITQSEVTNAATTTNNVYDIVTAFKNPDWNHLKIKGEHERTGLSEVRLTLGTTFVSNGRMHASSYSAISLPGKGLPSSEYMFNSQVGFNKHVGIIWGLNLQAPLTKETSNYLVTFNIDLENNFLIRNHQNRTFDLRYPISNALNGQRKEWSRYLLMRHKDETGSRTVPGVNVLTHKVRVSPHAIVDFGASLRATKGMLQAEIGYGLWAHGGDAVKITDSNPWKEEYQIAGVTDGQWASDATITSRGTDSGTFSAIKAIDLDLESGSQLPVVVHRLHFYTNIRSQESERKLHAGLGAFVEFPRNETKALSLYGIWLNVGGAL